MSTIADRARAVRARLTGGRAPDPQKAEKLARRRQRHEEAARDQHRKGTSGGRAGGGV